MNKELAVTAGCFLYQSWEALLIGTVGAIVACVSMPLIDKMGIDDPVGASAVHGNNTLIPVKRHPKLGNSKGYICRIQPILPCSAL